MLNQLEFKNKKWTIAFAYTLFGLYVIIAAVLLFFSPYRQAAYEINTSGTHPYNIIPFKTISNYIKASSHINQNIWISNLFGNVLAFLPMGFFLPMLFKRFNGIWKTTCAVFLATSSVEVLQFLTRVGSFDVDDIILNTAGGIIGYLLFAMVFRIMQKRVKE
ncbi:VanZ family protein [Heyndrickxia sp. MSNUG]|uniref:VanZ family protein n=1 Tax=Heyndrickxia sp. MSNUG TaxID=3136677 RepID=UPI003C2BF6FE